MRTNVFKNCEEGPPYNKDGAHDSNSALSKIHDDLSSNSSSVIQRPLGGGGSKWGYRIDGRGPTGFSHHRNSLLSHRGEVQQDFRIMKTYSYQSVWRPTVVWPASVWLPKIAKNPSTCCLPKPPAFRKVQLP